jgi:hypothetical protein
MIRQKEMKWAGREAVREKTISVGKIQRMPLGIPKRK